MRGKYYVCLGAAAVLVVMLLGRLGHPLFWADEAETAMFAQHVIEYGYPKVHGERNVVYQFGPNIAVGVNEGLDAYIGTTWGQFYLAVPGLLWAAGAEDPWVRTFRARLPFALLGALGVAVWIGALLPAFVGRPERQWSFAAAMLASAAVSISLLLHLREVRYYAPLVLLAGAIARIHLAYAVFGREGFRRWAVELALLLFLVFSVFFQAWFAFVALLGAERGWAVLRGRAAPADLLPFVASAALVAPLLVFHETFQTAAAFSASFRFDAGDYLANLGLVGRHFLVHEWLAPALVCRLAVLASGAGSEAGRRTASLLGGFALGYVLIGCVNPLALERYFVLLSPLVTGMFWLDAFALLDRAPRRGLAVAGLALLVLVGRWPAWETLRGRVAELVEPVAGPLDHVIPYLLETEESPEDLVVATNYEEYAFMYYLGSHTIIGLSGNNLVRDRTLEPDVVVPRRRWPASLRELTPLLRQGEWETVRFPVRDVHFNNVPALSRSRFIPDPHRFETPASDDPDEQLLLYRRRR